MTAKTSRTSTEKRTADTDRASREITAKETLARNAKTARLKAERLDRDAKLDEALDESFPASDPVEVGHSEHVGQPRKGKAR